MKNISKEKEKTPPHVDLLNHILGHEVHSVPLMLFDRISMWLQDNNSKSKRRGDAGYLAMNNVSNVSGQGEWFIEVGSRKHMEIHQAKWSYQYHRKNVCVQMIIL